MQSLSKHPFSLSLCKNYCFKFKKNCKNINVYEITVRGMYKPATPSPHISLSENSSLSRYYCIWRQRPALWTWTSNAVRKCQKACHRLCYVISFWRRTLRHKARTIHGATVQHILYLGLLSVPFLQIPCVTEDCLVPRGGLDAVMVQRKHSTWIKIRNPAFQVLTRVT